MTVYTDLQETLNRANEAISEALARRAEEVVRYLEIIAEKDREIEFLKRAIMQSALDFKRLQERANGDKSCSQSSTPNS